MKDWLKGGLIGMGVFLLYWVVRNIANKFVILVGFMKFIGYLFYPVYFIIMFFMEGCIGRECNTIAFFFGFLVLLIYSFIIGIIIDLIIKRFKKR